MLRAFLFILLLVLTLAGCERRQEAPAAGTEAAQPATAEKARPSPPTPPVTEDFEGKPQLSLFARLGAYRPEADDLEGRSYWRTYLDHLLRTSGPLAGAGREEGAAWALRSIAGLDSVGFFSPLAVEPETAYRVRFAFRGALPEDGQAGIGILEFDRFLWAGEQFTESLSRQHLTAVHPGSRLSGSRDWEVHEFAFTTSPAAGMIHLVLFREGEPLREPVFFDDISIAKLPSS